MRLWDSRSAGAAGCVSDVSGVHAATVTSVRFAPGGGGAGDALVLTCSRDNTLCLVDMRARRATLTLRHESYRTACNWSRAALSPDGRFVAAGSADGAVYVWDATTGGSVARLARAREGARDGASPAAIAGVSWSPGTSSVAQVAAVDRDGLLALWDDANPDG